MITPGQIRMARAGLRWTIEDLSLKSGVSTRTIKRIESADDVLYATMMTMLKIKTSLETAGVEFIGTPENGPGVRIRSATQNL